MIPLKTTADKNVRTRTERKTDIHPETPVSFFFSQKFFPEELSLLLYLILLLPFYHCLLRLSAERQNSNRENRTVREVQKRVRTITIFPVFPSLPLKNKKTGIPEEDAGFFVVFKVSYKCFSAQSSISSHTFPSKKKNKFSSR
jgi:hypothetical protein